MAPCYIVYFFLVKIDSQGTQVSRQGSYHSQSLHNEPSPQDMAVARRRVESSVGAFGGSHNHHEHSRHSQHGKNSGGANTIFQGQDKSSSMESATVTPSSSTGSPPRPQFQSRQKMKYEEELPGRYYENESRLSWEFEENPPVEVQPENDSANKGGSGNRDGDGGDDKDKGSDYCRPLGSDPTGAMGRRMSNQSPQQPKMRYRCKLCGQPKTNHVCPYQQSLVRNIGIMVYPAVNAVTAAEPPY